MSSSETKKRTACSECTKAKSKCSPYGGRKELCQRCERLNKDCIYEDSQRKRGPRTRSRMKQLEQRVESLMGMLASNGQKMTRESEIDSSSPVAAKDSTNVPRSAIAPVESDGSSKTYTLPKETPSQPSLDADAFTPYDPVNSGILSEAQADELLNEYRDSFTQHFPFVIIDATIDACTLRHQLPFLFLSIMAATTYATPTSQEKLTKEFRDQVAVRIIGRSHKSLEILQGLLVHTAYYHFFYEPGKQQLALMMQLCVGTMQDLGLSKSARRLPSTGFALEKSLAEKRAILGTYYLSAEFAHVWRRRTTMPYTRTLARFCQFFADCPELPSDALIVSLIRLSELKCRISDYFSYDEIEFSEIIGDAILDWSTSNFRSELQHLEDFLPQAVRENTTVRLSCDVLRVWIHECSLHSTLWTSELSAKPATITPTRVRMLQRTFSSAQGYLQTLINAPSKSLHHYAFSIWGAWFYSTLVIVKIIFLRDTGGNNSSSSTLGMPTISPELSNIIPEHNEAGTALQDVYNMTASLAMSAINNNTTSGEEEAEVMPLFQDFINKAIVTAARLYTCDHNAPASRSLLRMMATLQQSLLSGLKKRIEKINSRAGAEGVVTPHTTVLGFDPGGASMERFGEQQQMYQQGQAQGVEGGQTSSGNDFDNVALLGGQSEYQPDMDDWMWDLVMEDVNMFTM